MRPDREPLADLHPDVAALLGDLEAAAIPALSAGTPADARALLARLRPPRPDAPRMHRITDEETGADGQLIVLRLYEPVADPAGTLLYFHGGGWVVGSIGTSDFLLRHLARVSGLRVVAASYRLAPEHPFPAAVEDATTALLWTAAFVSRLPAGQRDLFVSGDSAGGNLATVCANIAAAEGSPPIAGQILFYPVVDHDFSRGSYLRSRQQAPLSSEDMVWFWNHYAPDVVQRGSPLASPIHAEALHDAPPTFIALADHDPLHDEGVDYAARLRRAGVEVELNIYKGTVHGFLSSPDRLEPARRALSDCAAFIQRRLWAGEASRKETT